MLIPTPAKPIILTMPYSSSFSPWVSHATKSKIQNDSLLYDIALPHFSTRFWGFYRGWSRVQMPSHAGKHLSPEFYYRVIFVQVFIICAGGEDQRHLLLGQFLPQQSSFLSIFPAAPYPYHIPLLGPRLMRMNLSFLPPTYNCITMVCLGLHHPSRGEGCRQH